MDPGRHPRTPCSLRISQPCLPNCPLPEPAASFCSTSSCRLSSPSQHQSCPALQTFVLQLMDVPIPYLQQQSQINITEAKATHCLHMMMYTLHCISQGGICDHLGGGFARYSVDEFWYVLVSSRKRPLHVCAVALASVSEAMASYCASVHQASPGQCYSRRLDTVGHLIWSFNLMQTISSLFQHSAAYFGSEFSLRLLEPPM